MICMCSFIIIIINIFVKRHRQSYRGACICVSESSRTTPKNAVHGVTQNAVTKCIMEPGSYEFHNARYIHHPRAVLLYDNCSISVQAFWIPINIYLCLTERVLCLYFVSFCKLVYKIIQLSL